MMHKQKAIIQWSSVLACGIIALQIAIILVKGEAFCLNDGCRIVENLSKIPPISLNICGLLFFFVLFIACRWFTRKDKFLDLPRLLLLVGLMVEGVLFSYQFLVIHSYCSYCLLIFFIVVALNIIAGLPQVLLGLPLFCAVVAAFAVLNFSPALLLALKSETLVSGTYAVKKCDAPAKKLYFFFSSECPHCKNVLKVLENCNNCEFHFNPIDKNQTLALPDLVFSASYSPSLNRVVLSLLNIDTIPVLLVHNPDGLSFIKGDEKIIDFVSQACFRTKLGISTDPDANGASEDSDLPRNEKDEECTIDVEECPEEQGMFQTPNGL